MKVCNIFKLCWLNFFIFILILSGGYVYSEEQIDSREAQFRIAMFKEKDFPSIGTPVSITPEWLYNNLSADFSVTYLDSDDLGNGECLNTDTFDLLVMPYGEVFPYKAFQNIKEYIFGGGGLLNVAGRPFWVSVEKLDNGWQKVDIKDPYMEFLSDLGIKYYVSEETQGIGLSVTTSLSFNPVKPTHGNVFPYRIPARDFLKSKEDVIFVKSWRNPYVRGSKKLINKWCLIGARGEDHPLNPQNPRAQEALIKIIEYLSYPIIMHDLETDLAAYQQGEKVEVSLKVMNIGKNSETGTVEVEFLDQEDKVVYRKSRQVELKPGQEITLQEVWQPEGFKSNFYKVTALLKKDSAVFDTEENGFVVINKGILESGPSIKIEKNRFIVNGESSLILGVNYYESRLGELLWLRPNLLRIREDFKSMRKIGINMVRIHYHHSKWFRDYFANVVKEPLDPYFEMADNTALPSERSLRILDAIIQIAQEEGLVFCMDIFSLVPEEMGNPVGWLGLKERILDKDKINVQKKFVEIIAQRYKDVPGITWDLWNEPRLGNDDLDLLRRWAGEIRDLFRKNGDVHPVTIGGDLSVRLPDVLDYVCVHTYEPAEFKFAESLGKPVIFQETWHPAGMGLEEEIRQKQELIKDFNAFLNTDAAGFMPWQWTRQARLWNNASEAEKWDDDLGICIREDGSLKPAGSAYYGLISKIKETGNHPQVGLK